MLGVRGPAPCRAEEEYVMSDIVKFEFGAHQVRTAGTPEAPLFCASDVCAVLGISDASQACAKLDQEDQELIRVEHGSGQKRAIFVNESGLYALVLTSRKPEARAFKRWVTSEVLPAIRKTGTYTAKPLTNIQQLVLQAHALAELEERQAEQVDALAATDYEVAKLASKVAILVSRPDEFDWIPVCACAERLGLKLTQGEDQELGRRASKISKERGVEKRTVRVSGARYQYIGSYHVSVLAEIFGLEEEDIRAAIA